jgi:hypothetical protein
MRVDVLHDEEDRPEWKRMYGSYVPAVQVQKDESVLDEPDVLRAIARLLGQSEVR